jgi:hypothetical protein
MKRLVFVSVLVLVVGVVIGNFVATHTRGLGRAGVYTVAMDDGSQAVVNIGKALAGEGVVVSDVIVIRKGSQSGPVNCSGSCAGGATTVWTCPSGQRCDLNCANHPPTFSCSFRDDSFAQSVREAVREANPHPSSGPRPGRVPVQSTNGTRSNRL